MNMVHSVKQHERPVSGSWSSCLLLGQNSERVRVTTEFALRDSVFYRTYYLTSGFLKTNTENYMMSGFLKTNTECYMMSGFLETNTVFFQKSWLFLKDKLHSQNEEHIFHSTKMQYECIQLCTHVFRAHVHCISWRFHQSIPSCSPHLHRRIVSQWWTCWPESDQTSVDNQHTSLTDKAWTCPLSSEVYSL